MSDQRFTILTYNFHNGGQPLGHNQWPRLFDQFQPDIVLAQETRYPRKFLPAISETCLYWREMNTKFGTAVVTPAARVEVISLAKPDQYTAVVDIVPPSEWPGFIKSPLRVVSLHVANRLNSSYPNMALQILKNLAVLPAVENVIIAGDFNLTVGIQHEGVVTTKKELEVLNRLKNDFGLMSAWQAIHPNETLAQTLRYARNERHYHCDGIFIPAAWYRYLESCEVIDNSAWRELSDHNPVIAKFRDT